MTKNEKLEKIFTPGRNVHVVLNADSLQPVAYSCSVFDIEASSRRMILEQTSPPIHASTRYDTLDVTAIVPGEAPGEKLRVGVRCQFVRTLTDYQLSSGQTVNAFEVKYTPAVKRENIRRAFRVTPNLKFKVGGYLQWDLTSYQSGTDYFVHDLSLTGIALIVPRYVKVKDKEESNSLFNLETGNQVTLTLLLRNCVDNQPISNVVADARVIRTKEMGNDKNAFIGSEFVKLGREQETRLVKFVQEVQLYDLRMRIS